MKTKFDLQKERENCIERERREEKREEEEEEEEEEEKKKRRREAKQAKVWNYMVLYGTTWTFNALNGSPCLYSH